MTPAEVVEVGPRDGFQPVAQWIPTDQKLEIIRKLYGAGIRRMETGAFVSPKAVPQMRDAATITAATAELSGLERAALVPNEEGTKQAAAAGVERIVFVFSASEAHNQSNVKCTVAESVERLRRSLMMTDPCMAFRINIATAFDCPFDGRVPQQRVADLVKRILELRTEVEIGLCDTTGRAMPDQVGSLCELCRQSCGSGPSWAFHAHDTYGMAIANVQAALQAGVRTFDSSIAGLGGCPFAPGATGNIATEDLVYFLHRSGYSTGVDLAALRSAWVLAERIAGATLGGHIRHIDEARLGECHLV